MMGMTVGLSGMAAAAAAEVRVILEVEHKSGADGEVRDWAECGLRGVDGKMVYGEAAAVELQAQSVALYTSDATDVGHSQEEYERRKRKYVRLLRQTIPIERERGWAALRAAGDGFDWVRWRAEEL